MQRRKINRQFQKISARRAERREIFLVKAARLWYDQKNCAKRTKGGVSKTDKKKKAVLQVTAGAMLWGVVPSSRR